MKDAGWLETYLYDHIIFRITECLFQCYQNKFNMLCEGTAGTLIMEMLARPLSSDILKNADIGTQVLTSFFNGMLPHTCKFLMEKQSFRISPELDAEIKRMYADRKVPPFLYCFKNKLKF